MEFSQQAVADFQDPCGPIIVPQAVANLSKGYQALILQQAVAKLRGCHIPGRIESCSRYSARKIPLPPAIHSEYPVTVAE